MSTQNYCIPYVISWLSQEKKEKYQKNLQFKTQKEKPKRNSLVYRKLKKKEIGRQKSQCAFSPDGSYLAIGGSSGGVKVLAFHPGPMYQIFWKKVFNDAITDIKYSPSGSQLAVASHDQSIVIFDVLQEGQEYRKKCVCYGHSSTVKHLDWSIDASVIQSVCQAYEILYFDPKSGKQIKDNQRDTQWHTHTCSLGFKVMGVWAQTSDGTDINAVDASPSRKFLTAVDDFGKVRLYNFPCVAQNAPCHVFGGHSSHVMNVRWSGDENYVVSVGGNDRAVFQWKVLPVQNESTNVYHKNKVPWKPVDPDGLLWAPKLL